MPVKTIKVEPFLHRLGIAVFVLLLLVILFYFAKAFFGNSISTQAQTREVAELAAAMAPGDSQTRYTLGILREKSFMPEDLPRSEKNFEQAVVLSPNDFRLWVALGKSRERNGNAEGAELALKEAKRLAPNYSDVQWAYGNILLRQGKNEQAFKEIRSAVEGNTKFASPAATTMWQIYDGDTEKIRATIGDSHYVNSALSVFLLKQDKIDEALNIWNSLPEEKKKTDFLTDGEQIYRQLLNKKKFRKALKINSVISSANVKNFEIGKIDNGGFESAVETKKPSVFEWNIASGTRPQINISSTQKKSGRQSLVISFRSTNTKDFRAVSQTVVVENGADYEFSAFYRSELEASATMRWEIVDTVTNKVIASTEPISTNTDWKRLSVSFSVPENSDGIQIRLARTGCKSVVCPISGKVWFDDFSIE